VASVICPRRRATGRLIVDRSGTAVTGSARNGSSVAPLQRPQGRSPSKIAASRTDRLGVLVDPLTPRVEIFGTALVGDRSKRSDADLRVERYVDVSNLSGIRVLVAEPNVTSSV
jgi:hypothetical protein